MYLTGLLGQELVEPSTGGNSNSKNNSSSSVSAILPSLRVLSSFLEAPSNVRTAVPNRAGTEPRNSRRERTTTEDVDSGDELELCSSASSRHIQRRAVDHDCSMEVNLPDRARSVDDYSNRQSSCQSSASTSMRVTRWSWSEKDVEEEIR